MSQVREVEPRSDEGKASVCVSASGFKITQKILKFLPPIQDYGGHTLLPFKRSGEPREGNRNLDTRFQVRVFHSVRRVAQLS